MLFALLTVAAVPAAIEISNPYLRVTLNPATARVVVGTTGGDPDNPKDDHVPMLFEKEGDGTSYATILVDSHPYVFGASGGTLESVGQEGAEAAVARWAVEGVVVTQTFRLWTGPRTGRPDTILIEYAAANQSQTARSVGVRLVLDTLLGKNDGVPFSVPGRGSIRKEIELDGRAIPDYLYALEQVQDSSLLVQATLRPEGWEPPDRVVFMNWQRLASQPWEAHVEPELSFRERPDLPPDSALGVYWKPRLLSPGATRRMAVLYGLYGAKLVVGEQYSAAVSIPPSVAAGKGFQISCDLENSNREHDLVDVEAKLVFPADGGLSCADPLRRVGRLAPMAATKLAWEVTATASAGKPEARMIITAAGYEETAAGRVRRTIEIPWTVAIGGSALSPPGEPGPAAPAGGASGAVRGAAGSLSEINRRLREVNQRLKRE